MCVSTLRVIRPANEAPTLEVIKEFFYLIGCLFYDKPVRSPAEAEAELKRNSNTDIDIILNLNVFCWEDSLPEKKDAPQWDDWPKEGQAASTFGRSGFIMRDDRRIFIKYSLPKRRKMKFYRKLINHLIIQIWHSEEEAVQQRQLIEISHLYFKNHLLGFLQSKRALRMINMGEALELDLGQQTIPPVSYIGDMLLTFNQFYRESTRLQHELDSFPYVRYASVNIARKIREVFQILEKSPSAVQERDGSFPSITYCSAAFLLTELGKLYRQEPQYPGTLFLAAHVCQSEPSQERNAGFYYQQLFKTVAQEDQRPYAFVYYEYGRYIERVEHNWKRAFRYYSRAAELDSLNYRALFKVACHEAGNRNFPASWTYFGNIIRIIQKKFSGSKPIAWENLSLPCIQYLFKTYMWMWKICLTTDNYSGAQTCLANAWTAAEAYQENKCLQKVYNPQSDTWAALNSYHRGSRPVILLHDIVKSRLDYTDMLYNKE